MSGVPRKKTCGPEPLYRSAAETAQIKECDIEEALELAVLTEQEKTEAFVKNASLILEYYIAFYKAKAKEPKPPAPSERLIFFEDINDVTSLRALSPPAAALERMMAEGEITSCYDYPLADTSEEKIVVKEDEVADRPTAVKQESGPKLPPMIPV